MPSDKCEWISLFFRMMWVAGLLAAMSTIIYPSISSLVSKNADVDQQGGLHHNDVISHASNHNNAWGHSR